MDRTFFVIGSISGFLAVALGAFGAHLLRDRIGLQLMGVFETGQRMHIFHTVVLLAVARAAGRWPGPAVSAAGWLFVAGIGIFSGSLTHGAHRSALARRDHADRRTLSAWWLASDRMGRVDEMTGVATRGRR